MTLVYSLCKPGMGIGMAVWHTTELVLHLYQEVSVDEKTGGTSGVYHTQSVLRIIFDNLSDLALSLGSIRQSVKGWERDTNSAPPKAQAANDRAEHQVAN